jgi:hypothetical protein
VLLCAATGSACGGNCAFAAAAGINVKAATARNPVTFRILQLLPL